LTYNKNQNYSKAAETVDVLALDGSPKSYKPFYVGKYMAKAEKYEDEIINATSITHARRRLLAIIGYVPDPNDKVELIADHETLYNKLIQEKIREKQNGDPNKQVILNETDKLDLYIEACSVTLGKVREKFDDAFGWYEKRCIMVIGPFGGGAKGVRRTFIGDQEIPKDGEYVNVKTGEKIKIRLQSLIKRNIIQNQPKKDEATEDEESAVST
jgi:hypothetical protein